MVRDTRGAQRSRSLQAITRHSDSRLHMEAIQEAIKDSLPSCTAKYVMAAPANTHTTVTHRRMGKVRLADGGLNRPTDQVYMRPMNVTSARTDARQVYKNSRFSSMLATPNSTNMMVPPRA